MGRPKVAVSSSRRPRVYSEVSPSRRCAEGQGGGKSCRTSPRTRLQAALELLGDDNPDAAPLFRRRHRNNPVSDQWESSSNVPKGRMAQDDTYFAEAQLIVPGSAGSRETERGNSAGFRLRSETSRHKQSRVFTVPSAERAVVKLCFRTRVGQSDTHPMHVQTASGRVAVSPTQGDAKRRCADNTPREG